MSYFEAWTLFAEITHSRRPLRVMRVPVLRTLGSLGSFWGRMTGREPDLNSASAAMSMIEHHFSAARAARELGYQIRPIRETARDAWDWFLRYNYITRRSLSA
jgi:dihydroflavonol-4-reductase